MRSQPRPFVGIVAALAVVVSVAAQQPTAPAGPTTKDPLRFRAILQTQGQDAGLQGVAEISIERWTTDEERQSLVDVLAGTTLKSGGQNKLLRALEKVKPRTGFIKLPNTLGWDLRYARDNVQPDGTRQIVVATDRPVSFAATASGAESTDYPFTILEMRMGTDNKGEGRMLARSAISTKDGRLQPLRTTGTSPSSCPRSRNRKKRRSSSPCAACWAAELATDEAPAHRDGVD